MSPRTLLASLSLLFCVSLFGEACHRETQWESGAPSLANRGRWKKYLQVRQAGPDEAIGTTQTQISNVSPALATAKIQQALESYDTDLGYRLTTVFQLGQESGEWSDSGKATVTDVVVNGHYYYIALLDFPSGETRGAFKKVEGKIPAIAVVDAEDETRPAWVRTHDEAGEAYEIVLRFKTQELRDENNIYRFLKNAGFTTYGCYILDDPTLEVDEKWRPFYTATYVAKDACPAEFGDGQYPTDLLVVDAQTRELSTFKLDDPNTTADETETIPDWVDRVYSRGLLNQWISDWGYNLENYGVTSKLDWFQADGQWFKSGDSWHRRTHLDLVMNAENTNLVFVAYITSTYADNSVIGVMLIDPRTGKAVLHPTNSSATAMATKSAATNTIHQATALWGYGVEDLTLHTIYGVRTWEGILTKPAYDNNANRYGSLYAGTVLLEADHDLRPADAVWADSKLEAFTEYEAQLYLKQTQRVGSNVLEDVEKTGVVRDVDTVVIGGNTSYLLRLEGSENEVWEVRIAHLGDPNTEDVLSVEPGNSVYLRYGDPRNRKTYLVRNIQIQKAAKKAKEPKE